MFKQVSILIIICMYSWVSFGQDPEIFISDTPDVLETEVIQEENSSLEAPDLSDDSESSTWVDERSLFDKCIDFSFMSGLVQMITFEKLASLDKTKKPDMMKLMNSIMDLTYDKADELFEFKVVSKDQSTDFYGTLDQEVVDHFSDYCTSALELYEQVNSRFKSKKAVNETISDPVAANNTIIQARDLVGQKIKELEKQLVELKKAYTSLDNIVSGVSAVVSSELSESEPQIVTDEMQSEDLDVLDFLREHNKKPEPSKTLISLAKSLSTVLDSIDREESTIKVITLGEVKNRTEIETETEAKTEVEQKSDSENADVESQVEEDAVAEAGPEKPQYKEIKTTGFNYSSELMGDK